MGEFITQNWSVVLVGLFAFADVVVSLTPTKRDDIALGYLRAIFNALTGRKRKNKI
tara:strand:+ start:8057 stop:8224 length:168 start_codon:yes stop_codon:yes gene_type:complete